MKNQNPSQNARSRQTGSSQANLKTKGEELKASVSIEDLAAKTAAKILAADRRQCESQLAIAKHVFDFAAEVKRGGKAPNNCDPFVTLAAELKSIGCCSIDAPQLRNYEKYYRLFVELGGEGKAPSIPMSHYAEVDREWLREGDKHIALLRKAEKDHLSVAELRNEINALRIGESLDWRQVLDLAVTQATSILLDEQLKAVDEHRSIPEDVRERLSSLAVLVYQFSEDKPEPEQQREAA